MAKRNVSEIETGAGFFMGFVNATMDVVREKAIPFAAIYRLATAGGRTTLAKIVDLAYADWQKEQPKPAVQPRGGYPYRSGNETNGNASSDSNHETITIPADATAEGLIEEVKTEFRGAGIPFTYFNEDLIQLVRQDLELVRGKTCKVLVHNFSRDWETSEGRDFQKGHRCDGNAAAYIVWVMKTKPTGWSVSIANDDARLFRGADENLYAPHFNRDDDRREFHLRDIRNGWNGSRSLVAFSAI